MACAAPYARCFRRLPPRPGRRADMFPIRNAVPTRYPPIVTWWLILTNVLIFLFQISLSRTELEEFLYSLALVPARYFAPGAYGDGSSTLLDYLPFFTMMFLHSGWLHLILNMWMLWLFCPTIEDRLCHGPHLAVLLGR